MSALLDIETAPVMEMSGISKRFDATQALDDVSLTLYPGETHALLGENGAGKSTLIKIMTGIHSPDRGAIVVQGERVPVRSPGDALRRGIAAIYQEPTIFPDLNVAENIFVGHRERGAVVRWRAMYRQAETILARLGVHLDLRAPASGLSVAAQQAVEIAKAISVDVRVLIMDEPTAALSAHEVARLFDQVRHLTESGVAVLFISHRLEEVFEIADRVTVLRDGRLVSSYPRDEVTPQGAIQDMVGREMADFFSRSEHQAGDPVLRVEHHPAHLAPVRIASPAAGLRRRASGGRPIPPEAEHPHAVTPHTGRATVRREPAEDDAREMAQHATGGPDPRRTHSRDRCRCEGRGPQDHRRTRPIRNGDHHHLVVPAGGPGHERPGPGHAAGPAGRRVRPLGGHPGGHHHGRDGGRVSRIGPGPSERVEG